jgi:MFS family permease
VSTPLAALQSPAFRRYQVARLCTILATQTISVAVGWQVYDQSREPLSLGLIGLFQFVPHLLLFPLTGAVADRFDRKRVVMACYAVFLTTSLSLAVIASLHLPVVWPIYAVLVLHAAGRSFYSPAAQAFLPETGPVEVYSGAMTLSSSLYSFGSIAGPALGGVVYAVSGSAAVTYSMALVLLLIALVVITPVRPQRTGRAPREPGVSRSAEVLAGLRFIFAHPIILGAITLDLFAVLLGGAVALLPIFARDILHTGPWGLGLLRAAPSIGALLFALLLARFPIRGGAGWKLLVAVAAFGAATVVFGLSTTFWLSLFALFCAGAADEVSVVIRLNLVQLNTPDHLRGRVTAAEFVFITVSNELGEMESGLAAAAFGAVPAVVLGGVGSIVVACVTALVAPRLRSVDSLAPARGLDSPTGSSAT